MTLRIIIAAALGVCAPIAAAYVFLLINCSATDPCYFI